MASEALANRMKGYWAKCEEIANVLGVTKQVVHMNMKILKKNIDFGTLMSGDLPTKEAALKLMKAQPQMRLFADPADPDPPSDARDLGLAFWYIKKIGDIDRAERVMKAAIHAAKALQK